MGAGRHVDQPRVVVPVATGLVAAGIASRTLDWPQPGSTPWWACVFALATVATVVTATAAGRFLPRGHPDPPADGPLSWLAGLPVIRSAVQAPTVAAPAALTAITLAAASALGVVTPLGQGRAAGAPPGAVAPAAVRPPADAPLAPGAGADGPVDVLAESFTPPATTQVPAGGAADVTPTVVADVGPLPDLLPAPSGAPAAVCTGDDTATPPHVDAVAGAVECRVVPPVEGLLSGLLDQGSVAEIVGNPSLLP